MFDRRSRTNVTFNARALPVANDPGTYEEHLEFAAWYHAVTSTRRVNRNVRESAKMHLSKYSLMQLRAIFLYALFENQEELHKGNVLDPLERLQVWERMERQRLVTYCARRTPCATDAAEHFKFDSDN